MLRGLLLRCLPFVCALPLVAGCLEIGGEQETSTDPAEAVGSVELGAHLGGAGGAGGSSGAECLTDVECGGPLGCGTCGTDGHCDYNDGVACGSQNTDECDTPNTCNAGVCEENFEVADTPCGDDNDDFCTDADTCDGNGVCQRNDEREGQNCDSNFNSTCNHTDTCKAGICDNNYEPVTTTCGPPTTDECTKQDHCDGNGNCSDADEPAGTACGDTLTVTLCNAADSCDGDGNCDDNVVPQGDPCGDQTDTTCNGANTCDNGGVCQENFADTSTSCGDNSNTTCTDPDRCDGAGSCDPRNALDGTGCGGSAQSCSDPDTCLSGVCALNHKAQGTVCGNPADTSCDNPDSCDNNGVCASNREAEGTPCDDFVTCTVDTTCNASGACVHNPSASDDQQCPTSGPLVECALWECDPPACADNEDCVNGCLPTYIPASTQTCRLSAGACDIAEQCSGDSPSCPTDVGQPTNHVCQTASCTAGVAKVQITCAASVDGDCPVLADVLCVGYQCDGAGVACLTSCTGSVDCAPDYYCDNTECKPRIDPGQSCTDDSECSPSNPYCVDGVCCDAKCDGQCESCNQLTTSGTCTVNPDGSQPSGDREDCAADGSSCDGYCDGVERQNCTYPGSATDCADAACDPTVNQATEAAVCDGAGACAIPEPVDCAPYICGATQCRGDCAADSDCNDGSYCRAGMCSPKNDDGEACTRAAQCGSGFCVDDVCCDARCDGQCEACNVSGNEGECSAVDGDPVGGRPACAGSGDCAGTCDGTLRSACTYAGAEQECREASCDAGVATLAAQCDGSGSCPATQTVDCPQDCEGIICGGDQCTIDANCPDGQYCTAGVCVPAQQPGGQCSDNGDCASGFCVDGVCCDSACLGQCEACDVSGSEGTCSPVPEDDVPHGTRAPCSSDGSACGGTCDGESRDGCSYPVGDVCRAGSCDTSDSGAVAVVEATCQGDGRCPAEQSQSCGQYACTSDGEQCDGDCVDGDAACASSEYCSAGICTTKQPDGTTCGAADQCQSGNCVDGVCCATACGGQCEACDVPGELGTCTPVSGPTHGGREACQGSGPCGAQCDGSSRDSCEFASATTSCGPAYCANGARSDGQLCDGQGSCTDGELEECLSQSCDGTACGTGCTTDADCTGENRCEQGVCAPDPFIDAVDEGTCGCRVPGRPADSGLLLLAGLLGSSLLVRRRQRQRQSDRAA